MYWKYFIHGTDHDHLQTTPKPKRDQTPIDGDEIKQFYEQVTSTPTNQTNQTNHTAKPEIKILSKPTNIPKKQIPQSLTTNNFLKAAQNNQVQELQEFLNRGFDINSTDMFGWTALMCASHSAATESIKLLLKNGANTTKTDQKGRNAIYLAPNETIRQHLKQTKPQQPENCSKKKPKLNKNEEFECDICEEKFQNTTPATHQTSTLHLFCKEPERPNVPTYQIPETNVGFQLLIKSGWNRENGLGVEGSGRKYPVKTVLKRDRKGLGKGDKKELIARVTHFNPGDCKAVENVFRKNGDRKLMSKSQRRRLENVRQVKEKKKEMKFRRMFYE